MKSFENFDARLPLTHGIVQAVRQIGEYKGREKLHQEQTPQVLKTLTEVAIIQSTESSNRIEGVTALPDRLRQLVAKKIPPRDRPEQEIAGYRDVLNTIHANAPGMKFSNNLVLQLHRDLMKFTPHPGGRWKRSPNSITERASDGSERVRFEPLAPHLTPEAMAALHAAFDGLWSGGKVERLLLIPAYVFDFLCIHPFSDGNGRMARLLTLLLLYKAGFGVGRYISLEKIIEDSRESYYDTLERSSQGWHQGHHTLLPWTEYFLGIITAAYREFEGRVGMLTTARGAKTEMVLDAIQQAHGEFAIADLQERCPTVGLDLLRRILREQKQLGELECLGRGPKARWRRK